MTEISGKMYNKFKTGPLENPTKELTLKAGQ